MTGFAEAVGAFRADPTEGARARLFRAIAGHGAWRVAATRAGDVLAVEVLRREDGATFVEAFSEDDALARFRAAEREAPAALVVVPGYALFASLPVGRVDRLNLDLHSPHATHFFQAELPELARWARACAVEAALANPGAFVDPLSVVARYDAFVVIERVGGGRRDIVLAPDASGRALAAVFTAPDTAEAFARDASEALGVTVERTPLGGAALFDRLAPLGLDGIVFNPVEGAHAVALSAAALPALAARTTR